MGHERDHVDPASESVEQVYNSVTSTLKTIGAVASPKSDVKLQHLSGPVGIGRIYYLLFQSERGWQLALWFSVISM
jgi:regulator of sigma E protease